MLTNVQTVYDVMYDVKDFVETGAFTLLYIDIVYIVEITRRHADHVVKAEIKWINVNQTPGLRPGQYKMIAKAYPDNGYTQLINREVSVAVKMKQFGEFCDEKMNRKLHSFLADETESIVARRTGKIVHRLGKSSISTGIRSCRW